MADRTLLQYEEAPNERGYFARLRIERSSAGQPGGIVVIEQHERPNDLEYTEATVVVDDLRRLLAATDWASDLSARERQIQQLGKPRIGTSIYREADQAILGVRALEAEVAALRALLSRVAGMGHSSHYVVGDTLAAYIDRGLAAIERGATQ